jgi:hypothetical protein
MSTKLSSKLIVHVSIAEKLSRDFSLPGGLSHLRQRWSSMNAPNLSPNWHDKPTSHCEENPLKKHINTWPSSQPMHSTHTFFFVSKTQRQPTSLVPHLIAGPQGHAPGSGTCGRSSGDGPRAEPDGGKSAVKKWLRNIKTAGVEKGETSLIFLSMESLTPDFTQVSAWNLRVLERSCNCFCQCLQHQFQVSTHNCIDMYGLYGKIAWLESPWYFIFQR